MRIGFKQSGLGDELGLTPVVRELRRRHPRERIDVMGRHYSADVWTGNPHQVGGTEDKVPSVVIDTRLNPARSLPVQFARQLGVEIPDDRPELFLSNAERAQDFGVTAWARAVAIDSYASATNRRWPFFLDLVGRLTVEGWSVLEVGRHPGQALRSCRSFLNQLSVRATAALLARCTLFIGNDSGLSHLAAAVGTPAVVIFSSTPWWTRAYRTTWPVCSTRPCAGCRETCNDQVADVARCLVDVGVDQVLAAVHEAERRAGDYKTGGFPSVAALRVRDLSLRDQR